jgi:hypothetical protein
LNPPLEGGIRFEGSSVAIIFRLMGGGSISTDTPAARARAAHAFSRNSETFFSLHWGGRAGASLTYWAYSSIPAIPCDYSDSKPTDHQDAYGESVSAAPI